MLSFVHLLCSFLNVCMEVGSRRPPKQSTQRTRDCAFKLSSSLHLGPAPCAPQATKRVCRPRVCVEQKFELSLALPFKIGEGVARVQVADPDSRCTGKLIVCICIQQMQHRLSGVHRSSGRHAHPPASTRMAASLWILPASRFLRPATFENKWMASLRVFHAS